MTVEERVEAFKQERLTYWATKCNMNDMAVAAVMQEVVRKEVAAYRKDLSSAREQEVSLATNLFERHLIPELQKAGLLTANGWTFTVTKDGTVKVGRLGVRASKVEAE